MNIIDKIRIVIAHNSSNKIDIAVPRGDWDEKLLWKILVQSGLNAPCPRGTTGTDDIIFVVPVENIDQAVQALSEYGLYHTILPKDPTRAALKITYSQ